MKKKILTIILCGIVLIGITGCGNDDSIIGKGTDVLEEHGRDMFNIVMGNKVCVPVRLTVYDDGNYELFTEYETCRPGATCTAALKYTKSIKGKYDYYVAKIIDNSENADDRSYSMDNLPEYEMYMGDFYVENGYGYNYVVEKGKNNESLNEFLKQIEVDLKVCAKPNYIK